MNILKELLFESIIDQFTNINIDKNNRYHNELIDAYKMALNFHDKNILKHANQYKSIEKLEQDVEPYLHKIKILNKELEDAFENGETKLI